MIAGLRLTKVIRGSVIYDRSTLDHYLGRSLIYMTYCKMMLTRNCDMASTLLPRSMVPASKTCSIHTHRLPILIYFILPLTNRLVLEGRLKGTSEITL